MKYLTAITLVFFLIGTGNLARAQQTSADPNQIAEWKLRKQVNLGTVRIISGGMESTSFRAASEIASIVNDSEGLRLLSVIGIGSMQNIRDVLYLRRVHLAIVQSDVLDHILKQKLFTAIERRVHYVTKLYNDEVHILARRDIKSISGLANKPVAIGPKSSGTFITASKIFKTLKIPIRPVHLDPAIALEQLRKGKISALVYVEGKPISLMERVEKDWNLHLLPLSGNRSLASQYEPGRLTSKDYPNLVPADEEISTFSVPNVMMVLNFKSDTSQYADLQRFIDAFFAGFQDLQKSPYHPKWTEVSLSSDIPKWTRFAPVEDAIRKYVNASVNSCPEPVLRTAFLKFFEEEVSSSQASGTGPVHQREKLFEQFKDWLQKNRN